MCVVSAVIHDWQKGPNAIPGLEDWFKNVPKQQPLPPTIDREVADTMNKVLKLLDKLDKKLDAKDCKVEEEKKAKFLEALKEIIDKG